MSIRQARMNAGYSQEKLAQEIGVVQPAVAMWESGKQYPTVTNLKKLSKVLNCSIDELLKEEGELNALGNS